MAKTSNSFGSIWGIVRGKSKNKKRLNQSVQPNISLSSRHLTLEISQVIPYVSFLTISYKGEHVCTNIFESNKFKSHEEANAFAAKIVKYPKVYARLLEIERGLK